MAAFKSKVKVDLELLNEEDMKITYSSGSMGELTISKTKIPKEQRGREARELLAASLAECACSTLLYLLKSARIDFKHFHATAEASTKEDEKGQLRVDGVNLKIHINTPENEETARRLERAKTLFNKGCLNSRSLEKGIRTSWTLDT